MFKREWQEFRYQVIPKTASRIQVSETKKAFYSGAIAIISLTSRMFSSDKEVTEQDINDYETLVNEIVDTCKSFAREHEMN